MNRNATHELTDAELDAVSGGVPKQNTTEEVMQLELQNTLVSHY